MLTPSVSFPPPQPGPRLATVSETILALVVVVGCRWLWPSLAQFSRRGISQAAMDRTKKCPLGPLEPMCNDSLCLSSLMGSHARLVSSDHLLHTPPLILTACPPVGPTSVE